MTIRKSAAILHGCNILHTPYYVQPCHSRSTSSKPTPTSPIRPHRTRTYATHAASIPHDDHEHTHASQSDNWPQPQHPHKIPTPYQILSCRRGDTYTKTRFTELVKIYHPDRCEHPSCRHLTQELRLERYRLIVTAHAILSDAQKRSAYDSLGAGWGAFERLGQRMDERRQEYGATTHGPDSPMGNATWEDWERWREKYGPDAGDREPQNPVFLSNTAFVSVIVMLAALGGVGQMTRAQTGAQSFLSQRNEAHEKAAQELHHLKQSSAGWTREERIKMFLRSRDPAAHDDEGVREMLLNTDICEAGDAKVSDRDLDMMRRFSDSSRDRLPRNPP